MFGTYIRKTWLSDPTLYAPARFRHACAYDVFIPNRLTGLSLTLSGKTAGVISDAEAAIRALNEGAHPGLDALQRLLLRTESIASSKVEGLEVDARSLARAEAREGRRASTSAPTALEVLANIDAMQIAIETATADRDARARPASSTIAPRSCWHSRRKPTRSPGPDPRAKQNWIGGNDYNPCDADYVPPPPEEIDPLLADLLRASATTRRSAAARPGRARARPVRDDPPARGRQRKDRPGARPGHPPAAWACRRLRPADQRRARHRQAAVHRRADRLPRG